MGLGKILGFNKQEPELPSFMTDGSLFDPEEFENPKVEVKVNGKRTPLTMGSSFICPGSDRAFLVTIGGIQITADGTTSYLCEWTDPTDNSAKIDIMTIDQIKRFVRRNTM